MPDLNTPSQGLPVTLELTLGATPQEIMVNTPAQRLDGYATASTAEMASGPNGPWVSIPQSWFVLWARNSDDPAPNGLLWVRDTVNAPQLKMRVL